MNTSVKIQLKLETPTWSKCDNRGSRSRSFRVFNDLGLFAFHDCDARVGRSQVDADDGARRFSVAPVTQTSVAAEKTVFVGNNLSLSSGNLNGFK
jgi:hypothetical protein